MGDRSAIEWTDATWNPIRARNRATGKVGWHCEHVSEGCRNCYAETMNRWRGTGLAYKPADRADVDIRLDEAALLQPLRWRRPRRVFVGSMTDVFGTWVSAACIDRIFAVMALCPQHTFQVLTKRPDRMQAYTGNASTLTRLDNAIRRMRTDTIPIGPLPHLEPGCRWWPLSNVWLGTSIEDQATANARIPHLLASPAAVRFVSAEPLLGPVDLRQWQHSYGCGCSWGGNDPLSYCLECGWRGRDAYAGEDCPGCGEILDDYTACPECDGHAGDGDSFGPNNRRRLDWIIVGGESGPRARPMHPEWDRSIRDQCAVAGVPFFFKQWGEWGDTHPDWPRATPMAMANDGTIYALADIAYPDGPRYGEAVRANHDKAQLTSIYRIGKKAAGRLLDGVEHNAMPLAAEARGAA